MIVTVLKVCGWLVVDCSSVEMARYSGCVWAGIWRVGDVLFFAKKFFMLPLFEIVTPIRTTGKVIEEAYASSGMLVFKMEGLMKRQRRKHAPDSPFENDRYVLASENMLLSFIGFCTIYNANLRMG